ncbi:MAG: Gfo/Idh/MocA family oxidoreductase [Chloroflexi bacterium]|nr:Gfo/Idh/MocA family oxidoreductase [Chloroflexota bacterium]
MSDLGVAIFGAGRAGHLHALATAASAEARLVAVFDADQSRADAFAEQHGCLAFTSPEAILHRDDVDLVMIALPNFLHASASIQAVQAGKHVFLEKPMADTLQECDQIIDAVERAGVQLLVAHSQRYFATTVRAREILQGGEIGRPVLATDTWYKPFGLENRMPWFRDRATGGGMWLMNGAHMIDRTCWVLDTSVASVQAWIGSPFHGLSADDANLAYLTLRNGLRAVIAHTGYKDRGVEKCEVEVACTAGMLRFDSYSNQLAIDCNAAYAPIELQAVDPFAEELKNLVDAIRGRDALRVSPAWGRHILEVLLAAEESSRTGREVEVVGDV